MDTVIGSCIENGKFCCRVVLGVTIYPGPGRMEEGGSGAWGAS